MTIAMLKRIEMLLEKDAEECKKELQVIEAEEDAYSHMLREKAQAFNRSLMMDSEYNKAKELASKVKDARIKAEEAKYYLAAFRLTEFGLVK